MKINPTKVLLQFDGTPIKNATDGEIKDATIREALVNALMTPVETDSGVKKAAKYDLAMRVYKQDLVDITAEEAATLKDCIGRIYGPIVVGQLYKILDGVGTE